MIQGTLSGASGAYEQFVREEAPEDAVYDSYQ